LAAIENTIEYELFIVWQISKYHDYVPVRRDFVDNMVFDTTSFHSFSYSEEYEEQFKFENYLDKLD
jgi:hypothetical protein